MNQLLKKILLESDYLQKEGNVNYFSKNDNSFFFTLELEQEEFGQVKSKADLENVEKFNNVLQGFNALLDSGTLATIEKNSSLIILVKCVDTLALSDLQQQILFFEEDEYFFKKYVILYTEDSIQNLTNDPVIPTLREKIKQSENFELLAKDGYKPELAEYLLIIQLFIKLPFLSLSFNLGDYVALERKIIDSLGQSSELYTTLLNRADEINKINFSDPNQEQLINEIMQLLPND